MKSITHNNNITITSSLDPSTSTTAAGLRHVHDKLVNGKAKIHTRSRDPLSNITNAKKSSESNLNNKKNEKPSSQYQGHLAVNNQNIKTKNTTKRTSTQSLQNDEKGLKNKKRKSDPMILDEDEENTPPSMVVVVPPVSQVVLPPPVALHDDIDQNDHDDPQAVVEYVNEIYHNLMIKEKDRVDPRYLNSQVEINEKTRAILVDWLVEVHFMFKLLPETLFLGVSIIDRFLSLKSITRDHLQLVGITSMLIACKYEEIYAPECNDFVYIADGNYTKPQILHMEQTILNTLNFNITHPSSLHFLRRYSKAGGSDYTLHTICKYLIEVVLIDVKFLKYVPSLQAAASVYLGRAMTRKSPLWTPTLEHYSTYPESLVRECALDMNDLLKKSTHSSLKSIRKKYTLPKFGQVAELPLVDL